MTDQGLGEVFGLATLPWDTFDSFECTNMSCVRHHEKHVWTSRCEDFMGGFPIEPKMPSEG